MQAILGLVGLALTLDPPCKTTKQGSVAMIKNTVVLALSVFAGMATATHAQIVVTGARSVADCPPTRVAPDRGVNLRKPRRERNPYFAARPVYPPVAPGTRASINFEPFTSKYYPKPDEYYPPVPTSRTARGR